MRADDFMRRKNEIIKRVTRKILIPEKLIKNVKKRKLEKTDKSLLASSCPYCQLYIDKNCKECPFIKEIGLKCFEINFTEIQREWNERATNEDLNELNVIIEEYNKDIKPERETTFPN